MTSAKSDPLLLAGKAITYIGQVLMGIAAIGILIGLPVIMFFQERIQDEWQAETGMTGAFPTLGIVAIMILGLGAVALVFVFLRKLREIINTVGEGDPFVPDNAERLTAMAWMMLAIQLIAIPITAIAIYLQKILEDAHADLLHERRMTLTELAERVGLTLANVSILKTGKAKAIRFSTLEAICRELECQPGDLLAYEAS